MLYTDIGLIRYYPDNNYVTKINIMTTKISKWTDLLNHLNDNQIKYVWNDHTETLLIHRVDVTGYKENEL